ncbi:MAG TPA: MATE family efflux transporter [Candidatus Paceibacterota bacterium]
MPSEKQKKLLEGPIISSLIFLAVPIVLTNLLQTAYQLIDAFWVGRLGGEAVAAVSVVFPISFLAIALGMGFSIAASTLVAQYAGAGKWEEVKHTASQSLFVALIIGVFLGLLGFLTAPLLLSLMGIEEQIYGAALLVMKIALATTPFTFLFISYQSLMRGVGDVMKPLYIVLSTVILNAILDPILIFGWGPIPAYGVAGAMIATFLTQGLAAAIGVGYLIKGSHGVQISRKDFAFDVPFLRRLFFLGIPTSMEQTVRALSMTIMTVLVAGFGTMAVAAYGVGSNVMMVVIIPALGLSMAVAALVGQNIGAGKPERATEAVKIGVRFSFALLTLIGVLTFLGARYVVQFFISDDAEVIALAVEYVQVVSFTFGLIGMQMVFFGAFRAAGSPGIAFWLTFVSQWVLQFPLAYYLSRHTTLGVSGIWWAAPITHVITVGLCVYWYMRGSWRKAALSEEDTLAEHVAEEILIEEGVRKV